MTEQEIQSTVAVVQKLCTTVHAIRSSYSGAINIVHTIRSVRVGPGTNVKPVQEPKQRAMGLNYTTIFAGVGIDCQASRFQQRLPWSASSQSSWGQKRKYGHGTYSFIAPLLTEIGHCLHLPPSYGLTTMDTFDPPPTVHTNTVRTTDRRRERGTLCASRVHYTQSKPALVLFSYPTFPAWSDQILCHSGCSSGTSNMHLSTFSLRYSVVNIALWRLLWGLSDAGH